MGDFQPLILSMRRGRKVSIVVGVETKDAGMVWQGNFLIDKVINFCGNFKAKLGVVRLQKRQIESELKVRQNERVPSRFDTRLWLYELHGRVQSEAFRFK